MRRSRVSLIEIMCGKDEDKDGLESMGCIIIREECWTPKILLFTK